MTGEKRTETSVVCTDPVMINDFVTIVCALIRAVLCV